MNECFTGGVRLSVMKEGIYPLLYCQHSFVGFLGAFANLREETISFVMSVRQSLNFS